MQGSVSIADLAEGTEAAQARLSEVTKPDNFLEIGRADAADFAALRDFVLGLPDELWVAENEGKFNKFECFVTTQHIVSRFFKAGSSPELSLTTSFWPKAQPYVQPFLDRLARYYGYSNPQFPKIMFARLMPRGVIARHTDRAWGNRYTHKVHVPLVTDPAITMNIADTMRHLAEGVIYEVNNCRPHMVTNGSAIARTHLIFEIFEPPGTSAAA